MRLFDLRLKLGSDLSEGIIDLLCRTLLLHLRRGKPHERLQLLNLLLVNDSLNLVTEAGNLLIDGFSADKFVQSLGPFVDFQEVVCLHAGDISTHLIKRELIEAALR